MLSQFRAERVLLLSELQIREKEKYYALLIKDEVKFRPMNDDRYVGNIRVLAPKIKKSAFSSPSSTIHFNPSLKTFLMYVIKLKSVEKMNSWCLIKNVQQLNIKRL